MLSDPPLQILSLELLSLRCTGATFLVLARMFVKGLLDFSAHKLHKIHTLQSLFIRLGPTCAPMILNRSTVLVEAMAVARVVTLERPPILLA